MTSPPPAVEVRADRTVRTVFDPDLRHPDLDALEPLAVGGFRLAARPSGELVALDDPARLEL